MTMISKDQFLELKHLKSIRYNKLRKLNRG